MPFELRDFTPVLRFLEQDPEANLMMLRAVRQGPRPGFTVIVDDPTRIRVVALVGRPDWRRITDPTMTLQVEARDPHAAAHLVAWLPSGRRYRILTYRSWISDLLEPMLQTERISRAVHCLATPGAFRPSGGAPAGEIDPNRQEVLRTGQGQLHVARGTRVFGLIEGGELVAFSTLAQPDTDFVSVQTVYTAEGVRSRGCAAAVLSAATKAGLAEGKIVSVGLPAEDLPALRMAAGLGYAPACREWALEGIIA